MPRWFCSIIVFGFVIEVLQVVAQTLKGQPWPLCPPLHYPRDIFMDFFNTNWQSLQAHPYARLHENYWPFTMLIARVFAALGNYSISAGYARLSPGAVFSFILFNGLYISALGVLAQKTYERLRAEFGSRTVSKRLLFSAFFLNAPFIVSLDRSNYVNLAFVFFSAFVMSEDRRSFVPIVLLAISCALKPYLLLCLLPLIGYYRVQEFVLFGALSILLHGAAIFVLHLEDFFAVGSNLMHYGDASTLAQKLYDNISLSNLISPDTALVLGSSMTFTSLIFYGAIVLYLLVMCLSKMRLTQKLFCATIVGVALPSQAYQYSLVLLTPFWFSLFHETSSRFGGTVAVLTALVFIWWHHWILFSGPMTGIPISFQLHVTEQTIVIPILLTSIMLLSLSRNTSLPSQQTSVVK